MDWAQILVIILAVFLALFLLLGIILAVMLIRITKQIRSVASSAERTATTIEQIIAKAGNATRPVFLLGLVKKFIKRKQRKENE